MSDLKQIVRDFLDALAVNDSAKYERILSEDVGMRLTRWDGSEMYRPRFRVVERLTREWSAWRDATLETFGILAEGDRVAVEFRIQATEDGQYVEHNRSAFLTIKDNLIQAIDLCCPEPLPSARRKGWIASADQDAASILRLFEMWNRSWDTRERIPPNASGRMSLRRWIGGTGDAHPGSNQTGAVKWSAEEADAKIEETIEYHRQRNIGFSWFVNPFDTPPDLRERLERHGMVLAGDQAMMARVGLEHLDIPTNPNVEIELTDGTNDAAIEAALQIVATGFNWTKEQTDIGRADFFERAKDPKTQEREIHYLARLNGTPVADARVILSTGIAYLGGASTLPAYRGQRIYSTMLRKRLEDAHARGYNVAIIHAEPMSRRVVSKYGFKEYGRAYLYAWMPVIDLAVIKSLVPDD